MCLDVSAPRATSQSTNEPIRIAVVFQRAPFPSSSLFYPSTINRPSLFSFPCPLVVAAAFSIPLPDLLYSRVGYSCVPRSVRHWQSGERHFHRKTAVSGAASFYVLRPIVNTRLAIGTFICSSASYARRLLFGSAFVRTSWSSIAVAVAKAGCGCRFAREKELPI